MLQMAPWERFLFSLPYGGFLKWGGTKKWMVVRENLKIDDLGVPRF